MSVTLFANACDLPANPRKSTVEKGRSCSCDRGLRFSVEVPPKSRSVRGLRCPVKSLPEEAARWQRARQKKRRGDGLACPSATVAYSRTVEAPSVKMRTKWIRT
jgi:hypothetical protein